MNPHYHHPPYPDLNSPHSPNSDGVPTSYHGHTPTSGPPNGHIMGSHHEHLHSHPAYTGGPINHHGNGPNSLNNYHHHQHYQHFLNNSSSNNNSNNNNNNSNNQNQINAVCAGCGNKIMDRFLLKAMERHWHHSCLKCSICQRYLADMGSTFFTKDNLILCKSDYVKIFGNSGACSACGQTIPANELVMRAGGSALTSSPANARVSYVFHIECFMCSKCNTKLVAGDRYCILANGSLVCERDWQCMFKPSSMPAGQQQTTGTTARKGKVGRPRRSRD